LERRRGVDIRQITCHLNHPPSTIPREARHGADQRGVTEAMATPLPSCEAMQAAPLAER
jgi:IS30 family transposase